MPVTTNNNTERYVAFGIGVILIFILLFGVLGGHIENQCQIINTTISLAAAGFAGFLSGSVNTEAKILNLSIKAGGTIAVFGLCFYFLVIQGCPSESFREDDPEPNPVGVVTNYTHPNLVVKSGEVFEIAPSVKRFSVERLEIRDGGTIKILPRPSALMIEAGETKILGKASIVGKGIDGANGSAGTKGSAAAGKCDDGRPGEDGGAGSSGGQGVNVELRLQNILSMGVLSVDISGGNGGHGGKGGEGGDVKYPSVKDNCTAISGGTGGNGGDGGSGGPSGSGQLNYSFAPTYTGSKNMDTHLHLITSGGNAGNAGSGGLGGKTVKKISRFSSLLRPTKDQKNENAKTTGAAGEAGRSGQQGIAGALFVREIR